VLQHSLLRKSSPASKLTPVRFTQAMTACRPVRVAACTDAGCHAAIPDIAVSVRECAVEVHGVMEPKACAVLAVLADPACVVPALKVLADLAYLVAALAVLAGNLVHFQVTAAHDGIEARDLKVLANEVPAAWDPLDQMVPVPERDSPAEIHKDLAASAVARWVRAKHSAEWVVDLAAASAAERRRVGQRS
jgi:hypothetical protein